MSGDTSGFWNVPWNAAPAAASEQPTSSASAMRGRRTWKNSVSCWAVQNGSMGTTRFASMPPASAGVMGKRPSMSEASVDTTTSTPSTTRTMVARRRWLREAHRAAWASSREVSRDASHVA